MRQDRRRGEESILPRRIEGGPARPHPVAIARCGRALVGTAAARTPLLGQRMNGSLYAVQPKGDGSPDIWASIRGQGLEINLRARTEVHDGQAVAKFLDLPDFPLRSLVLRLRGGAAGLLKLKRRPCGHLLAPTELKAQNGMSVALSSRVAVAASCTRDG